MFKNFDKHFYFNIFIGWLVCINISFTIYSLFNGTFQINDDLEHLRAAYFVSLGEVPYRDFFEHHHPLLWYVLAPLIKILPHKTLVTLAICRSISFSISVFTFYYVYKIMRFETKQESSILIFIAVIFWTINSFGLFSNVKPDTYARFCYFFGLYHLFLYFRDKHFKNLQICTISICFAFMFIQITIFQILPLIFPVGYFLYKNPNQIKNIFKALVIPIIMLAIAAYYFYINDALYLYYEKNWLLNKILSKINYGNQSPKLYQIKDIILFTIIDLLVYTYYRKFNIYTTTIAILFCSELLQRLILPGPIRYCLYLVIFSTILITPLLTSLIKKYAHLFGIIFFVITAYHLLNSLIEFDIQSSHQTRPYQYFSHRNMEHEKVLTQRFGIYHPRLHYYWMYPLPESIDNMFFGGHRDYNVEKLISKHKIRYIDIDHNCMYCEIETNLTEKQKEICKNHKISAEMYNKYKPVRNTKLMIMKEDN